LYDSKNDAVFIGSSGKTFKNLVLNAIHIDGTQRYGIYFSGANGNGQYCNIEYNNIGADANTNTLPSAFQFVEDCGTAIKTLDTNDFQVVSSKGTLIVSGFENTSVSVYDISGRKNHQTEVVSDEVKIPDLHSGIYLVKLDKYNKTVKVTIN
jgi:hypothetical protein